MDTRIRQEVVTFAHPFFLDELDEMLPAGSYSLEIEEERIDGQTFYGYRRTDITLVVRPPPGRRGQNQYIKIDAVRLQTALEMDQRRSNETGPGPSGGRASGDETDEPAS